MPGSRALFPFVRSQNPLHRGSEVEGGQPFVKPSKDNARFLFWLGAEKLSWRVWNSF